MQRLTYIDAAEAGSASTALKFDATLGSGTADAASGDGMLIQNVSMQSC